MEFRDVVFELNYFKFLHEYRYLTIYPSYLLAYVFNIF